MFDSPETSSVNLLLIQTLLESKPALYLRHRSPGRLRLGGPFFKDDRADVLAAWLEHPSIVEVQQNPVTGSVLVRYADAQEDAIFRHLVKELPKVRFQAEPLEKPKVLPLVGGAMGHLNQAVHKLTGGWFDAQVLIPSALCLYGVRRLLQRRQSRLPTWLTIFWWSYATLWSLAQKQEEKN